MSTTNKISEFNFNEDQRLLFLFNQLHQRTTEELEQNRQNLAQKLNDQIIQSLLALHIQLATQTSQPTCSPSLPPSELADMLATIADSVEELKVIARALRPLELDTLDLVDMLEQVCLTFTSDTGIPVTFAAMSIHNLPAKSRLLLFRLLQAALENVQKHAQASQVWVNLWLTDQDVVLKVEDDGQGLEVVGEVSRPGEAPGLTLFDMMLRFQQAGGDLTLQSHPDEGVKVTAVLPLKQVSTAVH